MTTIIATFYMAFDEQDVIRAKEATVHINSDQADLILSLANPMRLNVGHYVVQCQIINSKWQVLSLCPMGHIATTNQEKGESTPIESQRTPKVSNDAATPVRSNAPPPPPLNRTTPKPRPAHLSTTPPPRAKPQMPPIVRPIVATPPSRIASSEKQKNKSDHEAKQVVKKGGLIAGSEFEPLALNNQPPTQSRSFNNKNRPITNASYEGNFNEMDNIDF